MITAERLRELMSYDPERGEFRFLRRPKNNKARVGDLVAGHPRGGYLRVRADGKFYSVHRLAFLYMTGKWPTDEVDHINRDRADNRWSNLRAATRAENMQNKSVYRNKRTSQIPGVSWYARSKRWKAQIQISGKKFGLGYFESEQEAAAAYAAAKKTLHPFSDGGASVKA